MKENLQEILQFLRKEKPDLYRALSEAIPKEEYCAAQWPAAVFSLLLYEKALIPLREKIGESLIQCAFELSCVKNNFNENYNPRDPALKHALACPLSPAAKSLEDTTEPERFAALGAFADCLSQQYLKYQNYGDYLSGMMMVNPFLALGMDLSNAENMQYAIPKTDERENLVWCHPEEPVCPPRCIAGVSNLHDSLEKYLMECTNGVRLYAMQYASNDGCQGILSKPVDRGDPKAELGTLRPMSALFVCEALFCVLTRQYTARIDPRASTFYLQLEDLLEVHQHCIRAGLITSRNRYTTVSGLYRALTKLTGFASPGKRMSLHTLSQDLAGAPLTPKKTWLVFFSKNAQAEQFDPVHVEIVTRLDNGPVPEEPLQFAAIGTRTIGAAERLYRIPAAGKVEVWDNTPEQPERCWLPYADSARFLPVDAALVDSILHDESRDAKEKE